jgi:hypothetical protein
MKHKLERSIWMNMRSRCLDKRNASYKDYGGRGISVSKRWLNDFEAFFADMGPCPKGMSLERKENNGNYEPGNCVWASRVAQSRNRRVSIPFISMLDVPMTIERITEMRAGADASDAERGEIYNLAEQALRIRIQAAARIAAHRDRKRVETLNKRIEKLKKKRNKLLP